MYARMTSAASAVSGKVMVGRQEEWSTPISPVDYIVKELRTFDMSLF
jgi:hypothetical protein